MTDRQLALAAPPAALPALPAVPVVSVAPSTRRVDHPAETARSFEAVFVGQMLRIMMDTVPSDGPFDGGHGETMFRGVLSEKMGDAIARRGGFGIAPAVLAQIIRMQDAGA